MIVILPSEERVAVPDEIGTLKQLRHFLHEAAEFQPSLQRLFFQSSEITSSEVLGSLPDDAAIDLVLQVGNGIVICRAAMRDSLEHLRAEMFVPHSSMRIARRLDLFAGPPNIRLNKDSRAGKIDAAPYFKAFEAGKAERVQQLRLIRERLDPGPVVISTFNWGFRQMVENWAASCDHHNIECRKFTILFPTDEHADEFARDLGFETSFAGTPYGDLPTQAAGVFGDSIFRKMLFAKTAMTVDMLAVGGDFLRQDVDLVWMRDPRNDLVERMDRRSLDMQFMYDGPNAIHQPLFYNSGFIFIRTNSFTRHMWKTVFENYGAILAEGGEQRIINVITSCLRERGLRVERLPEDDYMNGHLISKALNQNTDLQTGGSVVHASWTSDILRKVENMRQFGLWYLD